MTVKKNSHKKLQQTSVRSFRPREYVSFRFTNINWRVYDKKVHFDVNRSTCWRGENKTADGFQISNFISRHTAHAHARGSELGPSQLWRSLPRRNKNQQITSVRKVWFTDRDTSHLLLVADWQINKLIHKSGRRNQEGRHSKSRFPCTVKLYSGII